MNKQQIVEKGIKNLFVSALVGENREASRIVIEEQGWGRLGRNISVILSPLNMGGVKFERGLGVHADSVLHIKSEAKIKKFHAVAGWDFNALTGQAVQKLEFSVVGDGKILWSSGFFQAKDGGREVNLDLKGLTSITLKIKNDGEGIRWAHADWADAWYETEEGKKVWLDELPTIPETTGLPFSFKLDGKSSAEFLGSWKKEIIKKKQDKGTEYIITWTDPKNEFEVRMNAIDYLSHSAVEWVLNFRNKSGKNSAVISDVKVLDAYFSTDGDVYLSCNKGSTSTKYDFMPLSTMLDDVPIVLDTADGRTSQKFLPFWNIRFPASGMVCALGWSGNWKAELNSTKKDSKVWKDRKVHINAGMKLFEAYLEPKEEARTPSFCMLFWSGNEEIRGNNLFRRFMRECVVPKWEGKEPSEIYFGTAGADVVPPTEKNQSFMLDEFAKTGANVFWLDAGWYKPGPTVQGLSWVSGRGNWFADPVRFPNGLKPFADRVHAKGMKFLLWFDPEIAMKGTQVWNEHPEWCIRLGEDVSLFNFAIPEAIDYMTNIISKTLTECGVDIFRNDYNINPEEFWRKLDKAGRKGITELRYVEGVYRLWDELRKRHPKLLIDNCASGGRRIDFETSKRSVPLWRSDVQCDPNDPYFIMESQNQTYGLSMYLPYHSGGAILTSKYNYRSCGTAYMLTGFLPEEPVEKTKVPVEKFKALISEWKRFSRCFAADYYPLTPFSLEENAWCVYQFNDEAKGEGVVLCLRRKTSPFSELELDFRGLASDATYEIEDIDTGVKTIKKGKELGAFTVRLPKEGSKVILYKRK